MIEINIQTKINKIILALLQQDRIIKIQTQENYSMKFKKIFRVYKIIETTETEIELKKEFYSLRREYKNKSKPPEIIEKIKKIKLEIDSLKIPKVECKSKVKVLLYLIERYKSLKNEEELIK